MTFVGGVQVKLSMVRKLLERQQPFPSSILDSKSENVLYCTYNEGLTIDTMYTCVRRGFNQLSLALVIMTFTTFKKNHPYGTVYYTVHWQYTVSAFDTSTRFASNIHYAIRNYESRLPALNNKRVPKVLVYCTSGSGNY